MKRLNAMDAMLLYSETPIAKEDHEMLGPQLYGWLMAPRRAEQADERGGVQCRGAA